MNAQITLNVPTSHPMTPEANAIEMVVVIKRDDDGGNGGVYPNVERAELYIRNWLGVMDEPGNERDIVVIPFPEEREWRVLMDGEWIYTIQPANFRM
jgi:hypothetical protein